MFPEVPGCLLTYQTLQFGVVEVVKCKCLFDMLLAFPLKKVDVLFVDVVDPLKLISHPDGKTQGCYREVELLFHLVEQVKGVFPFPVQFVDEDDHRDISHPADLHQFLRLFFHPFSHVNDYYYAIHRS